MPAARSSIPGKRSQALFTEAKRRIPGGVNSPVRAWGRLGGKPPFIDHGEGPLLVDADGTEYIDYVCSWGPLIVGHAHPRVVSAVQKTAEKGLSFGAPTGGETELARLLCDALPGMNKVRLVNSGTEAVMSALRLARAATGRDLVIKCDGCYHGHADHLLVAAGSGAATFGNPDSAGVPRAFAEKTLVAPYNDADAIERMLKKHRKQVAAIIVEPVAGNMGFVKPLPGYLEKLRELCDAYGALLVFDEVMTGFRCAWGGYQVLAGVQPDLTCLGKVVGGGLPLAAYGGKRDIMAHLSPDGPCYQAGTLSGNPIAVTAGLTTLKLAANKDFYGVIERRLGRLVAGLKGIAETHGIPFQADQIGTMWGYFFADKPVTNFAESSASDHALWKKFVIGMYENGVYLAPSPFEAAFISSTHTKAEIDATLEAAETVMAGL